MHPFRCLGCVSLCCLCRVEQSWYDVLETLRCGAQGPGLHEMCEMLVANDVYHWTQLEHAGDPMTWTGADIFSAAELTGVELLQSRGKEVPRCFVLGSSRMCWCCGRVAVSGRLLESSRKLPRSNRSAQTRSQRTLLQDGLVKCPLASQSAQMLSGMGLWPP